MSASIGQLLLVLAIVLVLFGAGKLPKMMGDFGSGIRNFRKNLKGEEKKEANKLESEKEDEQK